MGQKTGISKNGKAVAIVDNVTAFVAAYLKQDPRISSIHLNRSTSITKRSRESSFDLPELKLRQSSNEWPEFTILQISISSITSTHM